MGKEEIALVRVRALVKTVLSGLALLEFDSDGHMYGCCPMATRLSRTSCVALRRTVSDGRFRGPER